MRLSTRAMSTKSSVCCARLAARRRRACSAIGQQLALRVGPEQAVPLREEVVLDADGGDPGALVFHEGPDDVPETAEAVVAIGDDRQVRRVVDADSGGERLGHGRQVHVGHGVGHRRHAEAADPDRVEAMLPDELRGQRVVRPDGDDRAVTAQALAQSTSLRVRPIHVVPHPACRRPGRSPAGRPERAVMMATILRVRSPPVRRWSGPRCGASGPRSADPRGATVVPRPRPRGRRGRLPERGRPAGAPPAARSRRPLRPERCSRGRPLVSRWPARGRR